LPLLSGVADVIAIRNGLDLLAPMVKEAPRNPQRNLWLGEALQRAERDMRAVAAARMMVNPYSLATRLPSSSRRIWDMTRLTRPPLCGVTLARDEPGQRRHARQQHLALTQPADGAVEDRDRVLARRPRAVIDPDRELGLGVDEVAVADLARDLPLVLQARLLALRVRRHAYRGDVELRGDVLDDVAWNVTEISKERPDEADGRQLHREAQTIVIATATTDATTTSRSSAPAWPSSRSLTPRPPPALARIRRRSS